MASSVSIEFVLNAPEQTSPSKYEDGLEALRPVMRRSAAAVLRREEDIDDAVQEAMLKLVRQGGRLDRDPALLRAYACTAVRRVALDMLARRNPLAASDTLEATMASADAPALDDDHVKGRLRAAIDRLPDPQRTSFLLVHQEGLEHPQAAQELRISQETLRARLYRARLTLRSALKDLAP